MIVKLWRRAVFWKQRNSTRIPDGTEPVTQLTCDIWGDCTTISPVLKIDLQYDRDYNYAYIGTWGRFYFVTKTEFHQGFCLLYLEVDVLATYRAYVRAHTAFITRATAKRNPNIPDSLFTSDSGGHSLESRIDNPFKRAQANTFGYIIQYTGKEGIETAYLEPNAMQQLVETLWNNWAKISGMTDVYAAIADPFQYIVSVQKTPASRLFWNWAPPGVNILKNITLGTVQTGVQGLVLNTEGRTTILAETGQSAVKVYIPRHPQSSNYPFLKGEPYSKYSLKLPGIGWINIPADMIYQESYLYIIIRADPNSGDMLVEVLTSKGNTVANARGNINIPWGISNVTAGASTRPRNTVATGKAIVNAGKSLFTPAANPLDYISNVANAFSTVGAGFAPNNVETNGSGGGEVGLTDDIILQLQYANMNEPDPDTVGYPLMETMRISQVGAGYIQCAEGTFSGAQTVTENDMVNAFMTGGFFYVPE